MRYFNSIIIIALTAALLLAVLLPRKDNRPFISLDRERFELLIADSSVTVVDVRTPEEYARWHYPRAININVQSRDFDVRIDSLDNIDDIHIVAVYDRYGNSSKAAATIISARGFVVFELNEGVERRGQGRLNTP